MPLQYPALGSNFPVRKNPRRGKTPMVFHVPEEEEGGTLSAGEKRFLDFLRGERKDKQKMQMEVYKQKVAENKGTIDSLTGAYHTTDSPSMRATIADTLRSFVGSLTPAQKKAVEPYIKGSPISPIEEKRRQFAKHNPEPRKPYPGGELTIKTIPGEEGEDSIEIIEPTPEAQEYAEYLFNKQDWKEMQRQVVYGKTGGPGANRAFIPISETYGALRNPAGQVVLVNQNAIFGDNPGEELKEAWLNGGVMWSKGPHSMVVQDGVLKELVIGRNIFDEKGSSPQVRVKDIKKLPEGMQDGLPKLPSTLLKAVTAAIADDETVHEGVALRKLLVEGPPKGWPKNRPTPAEEFVTANWPGWSVNSIKLKDKSLFWSVLNKLPILGYLVGDPKGDWLITATKGHKIGLPTHRGTTALVYQDGDIYRNKFGSILAQGEVGMLAYEAMLMQPPKEETEEEKKRREEDEKRKQKLMQGVIDF